MAAIEPVAYLFSTTAATAALGFAEPEILYAAGTELEVQITAPLITSKNFPPSVPPLATSAAEEKKLGTMVRALPFRTATQTTNKPSDLTNLAFIGSADPCGGHFKRPAGSTPINSLPARLSRH